jgi:hypothetical protein
VRLSLTSTFLAILAATAIADGPAPSTKAPAAKAKAKADVVPGYELRMVEGFTLLVNRHALSDIEKAKNRYTVEPLDVLEGELKALNTILMPKVLKPMQTVRIFVEWDNLPSGAPASEEERGRGARVVALYRSGSPLRAWQEGNIHPLKMNAVEIMSLKRLTEMHQPGNEKNQIILLHELCHTIHHVFLNFENRDVKAAYQQAMDRQLYENAYARTNAAEYFAEISCAYLDRCNQPPHTADELKSYDPIGYKLMEQVWGKQEIIQKARDRFAKERAERERLKKRVAMFGAAPPNGSSASPSAPPDSEKIAAGKLDLIKLHIQDGRIQKAKERLAELIKDHPDTKAAQEAKALLASL